LRLIAVVWSLVGAGAGPSPEQPRQEEETGSALSAKEAADVVEFHNKVRRQVGIEPVKWSPELARFAQEWADEVARTGKVAHRPREGEGRQRYGENIAWGWGGGYGVLKAVESWYAEMKFYEPGTPIPQPQDFGGFRAGHYTQMVWKNTTVIGVGKATIQEGELKGWLVVVCNYDPPGNIAGEKPY
jgi:pathogenesis-related protein 1